MKFKILLLIGCLWMTLICSFLLPAQTTVLLQPTKDNTIYSSNVNNSNALGDLFAGRTGAMNGGNLHRALVRFSLKLIPTNAIITNATLSLNKNKGGPGNTAIHKLTTDWGEGTSDATGSGPGSGGGAGAPATAGDATWMHSFFNTQSWNSLGGDYVPTSSATTLVTISSGQFNWNSPAMVMDVQNWLDDTTTNYGWILIGDESNSGSSSRFNSREDASHPVLAVEYTISCLDTLMLSGIIDPNTYQAAKLIKSDGTIQSPSMVIFDTGVEAILEDEFSVLLGAEFEIRIGGCP